MNVRTEYARRFVTRTPLVHTDPSPRLPAGALCRCAIAAVSFVGLAWMAMAPALAEDSEITTRRSSERIGFSNEEIADGSRCRPPRE
jgi:hypothetical protein